MKRIHSKFKKFLFIIFCLIFFLMDNSFCEERITKKYAYGYGASQGYTTVLYGKPKYYPLVGGEEYNILYPGYFIDELENIATQSKTGVYIRLSLKQNAEGIEANLVISNSSKKSFFMFRGSFIPCSNKFLVVTENVRLDYLGGLICNFGTDYDQGNWVEVKSGEKLNFDINLVDLYIFPASKKRYVIGSLEYPFFDEKWMIWSVINEKMFSLFNFKYNEDTNWDVIYLMPEFSKYYSEANVDDVNEIRGFLDKVGLANEEKPSFYIRSNTVVIDVDGGKLHGKINGKELIRYN